MKSIKIKDTLTGRVIEFWTEPEKNRGWWGGCVGCCFDRTICLCDSKIALEAKLGSNCVDGHIYKAREIRSKK